MRGAAPLLAIAALACVQIPDPGEALYRQGDPRGALDAWRAADDDDLAPRIAAVEQEIAERAQAHVSRAAAHEAEGRLAEAILDYRLALALRPEDDATLDHVQQLARVLVEQRAELLDSYWRVRDEGDLRAAGEALQRLRVLDPFEPEYETEERHLRAAIAEERQQRRAQIRREQAARVESLIEAGRLAFGDEQLETALDYWRRALLIDPENERLQAYIARAEEQLASLERLRSQPDGDR